MRRDVQGLRAVAVLGVVLYHVDRWAHGGFVGVDVFFVISGFVIAGSILRRRGPSGWPSLVDFYRRRAVRILPALVVFILGSMPFVLLGPASTVEAGTRTAAAAAVFVANLQLVAADASGYFSPQAELNPYLHLWSLSVEEQFYLGFPLLLVAGLWLSRGRSLRPLAVVLGAATAGSFLLMIATLAVGKLDAAFYLAPTRAWEFLAGALLAVVASPRRRPATAGILRIGGLAAIALTMVVAPSGAWPSLLTVVTVGGTVAVIAAGSEVGAGRWILEGRAMGMVGALSYSWYLWHWPIVVTARLTAPGIPWMDDVAALAALIPAWLSWHYVEEPLRHRDLPPTRALAVRSAAVLAVAVIAAAVVLPAIGDRLPGNELDVEQVASVAAIVALDGCPSGAPTDDPTTAVCGSGGAPERTAVLLGDSFAGQVAEPFATAAHAAQWHPVIRTRTACPFLPGLEVRKTGEDPASCVAHVDAAWQYLRTHRPAVVVVSNMLNFALVERGYTVSPVGGVATAEVEERRRLVESSYRTMVEELHAQGTQVVLLRGTPENDLFNLSACPRLRWVIDATDCGKAASRDVALGRRASADAVLDVVGAALDVPILDFDDELCPVECRAHDERGWVYADHGHITAQFARTLEPMFSAIFAAVPAPGPETPVPGSQSGTGTDTTLPTAETPSQPVPGEPDLSVDVPDTDPAPDVTVPDVTVPDVTVPDVTNPAPTVPPGDPESGAPLGDADLPADLAESPR